MEEMGKMGGDGKDGRRWMADEGEVSEVVLLGMIRHGMWERNQNFEIRRILTSRSRIVLWLHEQRSNSMVFS